MIPRLMPRGWMSGVLTAAFSLSLATASHLIAAPPSSSFDAASANNAFGVDLYRRLAAASSGSNLVISPVSITQALALAASGGVGPTRKELLQALRLPTDEAAVQSSLSALRLAIDEAAKRTLDSRSQRQKREPRADIIEWRLANRLFGQSGHDFRAPFLAAAQSGYDAGFEALDFRAAPEAARATINAWVDNQTRHKIPELIPPSGINRDTRLILVNALYLKAPWSRRFEARSTTLRPFHLTDGNTRNVPTMMDGGMRPYLHAQGFTTIGLEFEGREFQFLVFLPDVGVSPASVAEKLTPQFLQACTRLTSDHRAVVVLYLPKIGAAGSTVHLRRDLRSLGVTAAFDEPVRSADFSAIAPRGDDDYLRISEVVHQTFFALDEQGIEAAAGTAETFFLGAPSKPVEVHVDRPFLFAVQHVPTGACLLLGHIADPR